MCANVRENTRCEECSVPMNQSTIFLAILGCNQSPRTPTKRHQALRYHDEIVRGALLTKESGSSFAEAHRKILSEPTHIEGEFGRSGG